MENNELYHFGIEGMKWGVRRYQNPDGSRTEEGKRHYGYKFVTSDGPSPREAKRIARIEKKQAKLAKKAAAKEAKEAKKREKHEEEKRKAIRSGSAEQILKFKDELTIEEKNEALRRLQADSNLMNIAKQEAERNSKIKEQKSFTTKMNDFSRGVDATGKMIGNMSTLYNNSAKIINAFGGTELPLIGEKKAKKTWTQHLAEEALRTYTDMSYEEVLKMDVDKLDDVNERLTALKKLEDLKSGKSKKK